MKPHAFVLIGAGILAAESPSWAQSDALHRAYELRRAGHDEEALPLLREAFEADRSPRIEAQLGLCEQATGDFEHAEEHLREALTSPSDTWVARHLDGLTMAHNIVLLRVQAASVSQAVPAVHELTHTALPAITVRQEPPFPRHVFYLHGRSAPSRAGAYIAIAGGSALVLGGVAAWAVRESVVVAFNNRGCRVGDPMLPASCNVDGTRSARDIATGLTVTGLVTGAVLAAVGVALVLQPGEPREPRVACGGGPGAVGVSCAVSF